MINNKNAGLDKLNVILHVTKKMQYPTLFFRMPPALKKTKLKTKNSNERKCRVGLYTTMEGANIKSNEQNLNQGVIRKSYAD